MRDLYVLENTDEGLLVGAGVNLSQLGSKLKEMIASLPSYKTRVFQAFAEMLKWFAGQQIRNIAVSHVHVYLHALYIVTTNQFNSV